jgi:hypothetical protein
MTLSALIRKRGTGNLATAIPAIFATHGRGNGATVARIATVAVANPKEEKTAPPANVSSEDEIYREAIEERAGILEFEAGYPRDEAERLAELQVQGRNAGTSWRWLVHFVDRDPLEVSCFPEASHAEILSDYPNAVAAEPVPRPSGRWSTTMSPVEESATRSWLAGIGERDQDTVAEVIEACQRDAGAREYFIGRANSATRSRPLPGTTQTF